MFSNSHEGAVGVRAVFLVASTKLSRDLAFQLRSLFFSLLEEITSLNTPFYPAIGHACSQKEEKARRKRYLQLKTVRKRFSAVVDLWELATRFSAQTQISYSSHNQHSQLCHALG